MFIESVSFASSATAGIVAANAGSAVLTFFMIATPAGWVGLIVGGVVIGAAAAASIGMNNISKRNAGPWYDNLMSLLSQ